MRCPPSCDGPAIARTLSVLCKLGVAGLVAWPLVTLILTLSHHGVGDDWSMNVRLFAGFAVDSAGSAADAALKGRTYVDLASANVKALWAFAAQVELAGIATLLVAMQLRGIGAAMFVLAAVMDEATAMDDDQQLTI